MCDFCGLLVQKAVRLSFNSAINENPRGNSLCTKGAFPKGNDSQSTEHFKIKRILPALCMGEPWGSISGEKRILGGSVIKTSMKYIGAYVGGLWLGG